MKRSLASWLACLLLLLGTGAQSAAGRSPDDPAPGGATGSAGKGGFGVTQTAGTRKAHAGDPAEDAGEVGRTTFVDCGPPTVAKRPAMSASTCSQVWLQCDVETRGLLRAKRVTDFLILTTYRNGEQSRDVQCNVAPRRAARPEVTGQLARQAAEKLLPHPAIGTAPAGNVTLVNIETVLWVDTSPDRTLGTVTLLAHRVTLRAHLQQVRWSFGDHSTDSSAGPGKAYTSSDPCRTAQCPGYFGHTYLHTGGVTIAAQLTWTGQFRVDNGAWQAIPGTVIAAATNETIRVKEARGVLIPNP
jgi:hypothetical protein